MGGCPLGQAYKWCKYGVRARRIAELEARKQAVAERSKAGRDGQMSWCACRAAARERKARPLLRCPARASRNAVRSPLPTAAPKSSRRTHPGGLTGQRHGGGKRGPSCGARRGLRGTQSARPCRPLRQKILPASAAGGGRIFCPRLSALGSKPPVSKMKGPAPKCGSFRLAEKEGFEPSRRFPDLRP